MAKSNDEVYTLDEADVGHLREVVYHKKQNKT